MKLIRELSGHSGCQILLYKAINCFVVRKIASSINYNARLRAQLEKQAAFSDKELRAPAIYDYGQVGELFYCDMEYVSGTPFYQYLAFASSSEIETTFAKLLPNVSCEREHFQTTQGDNLIRAKVLDLGEKLGRTSPNIMQAIDLLREKKWGLYCQGRCHGDMTFENIIVDGNGRIYLIDFLDSFYESLLIDIAKLLQDVILKWSYFKNGYALDENVELKLMKLMNLISANALKHQESAAIISETYYLLLLNLVRIVPYSRSQSTDQYLENAVKCVINLLDNKKGH